MSKGICAVEAEHIHHWGLGKLRKTKQVSDLPQYLNKHHPSFPMKSFPHLGVQFQAEAARVPASDPRLSLIKAGGIYHAVGIMLD